MAMNDFDDGALSEEENQALLEKAADEILKRKLQVPAILMLQSYKPLSYIGSQATIVFAPFLVPYLGFENIRTLSKLLENRDNVERLTLILENRSTAGPKELSA